MENYYRKPWVAAMLRACGALLLVAVWISAPAFSALVARHRLGGPTMAEVAAAILLFLSASLGCALALLGKHLLAPVIISARWSTRR
ncbi:MAG TPA: hypothetical protein VF509_15390 [Sphingobium sp.]